MHTKTGDKNEKIFIVLIIFKVFSNNHSFIIQAYHKEKNIYRAKFCYII